ncbi:ABC transporter permease [Miltoncostaea marina]|uniref:ABC transporter permease n=1 Tax=Miltoncostaea marina TaxID=2843215 RepID=UPI001C3E1528|nr:ABC transporter permease [Miltoncostaea marina]
MSAAARVRAAYAFRPRGALRMWQRNATVGRSTLLTTLTPRFLEAIAYLAIMGLGLGTYLTTVEGVDYVDFIAPGVAASTVMFGAIIETTYNSFVRIHVRKVVEAVVTTPLSLADVVVGEYLWAATRAVVYGVVFLVVMAAFGLVHTPMALLLPPVFAIGALTFAVLGMMYTSLVSNIEHFNILFTGLLTPMFLFGGVFFPFSGLPDWAQAVGWCLPLSHLVAATRDLTLGGADAATLAHVGALLAVLLAVFPWPAARLRRTLLR